MMKFILMSSVCAIVLGNSSCTKSYTCTCYDNNSGVTSTSTVSGANTTDAALKCSQKSTGNVSCDI